LLYDSDQVKVITEILKFRHRFCNLYGEALDPVKTTDIQSRVVFFYVAFPQIHESFCSKLRSIAGLLT